METTNDKMKSAQDSYLTFKLGEEEFAVHVNNVLNILELTEITDVPKTPEYMKGVINLRGTVLPVIDIRLKLGMEPIEYTNNTCIVVMEIPINEEKTFVGSLVDKVEAVYEIDKKDIKEVPEINNSIDNELLNGMVETNKRFIMILDIEKAFTNKDFREFSNVINKEQPI